MKINELIALLEEYADEYGDLEIISECPSCSDWYDDFALDLVNDVLVLYSESE